ncbi:MAG: cold shock domain-containing protein [Patescibacteria group bacterium]|jgi:CspA family cold shock protein
MQGKIRSKNDEKGFGFITVEGQEKDTFFHKSALVGMTFEEIQLDDMVSFDTEDSEKGPRAVNVQRA